MSRHVLRRTYRAQRGRIALRLKDFRRSRRAGPRTLFEELSFCLLTPQSKAESCDRIIKDLKNNGLLFKSSGPQLWPYLKRTRFYRKKSQYLIAARKWFFKKGAAGLTARLLAQGPVAAREWLVAHVKGLGYKEASHFLRNIGWGEDLAILDIHILRRLRDLGVIREVPNGLTARRYLEIEARLKAFAREVRIPVGHLDLLFWSMGTGKIFK